MKDTKGLVWYRIAFGSGFGYISSYYTTTGSLSSSKLIALSFDDGPSKYTPMLLDGLKARGIKATFFVVGGSLQYYGAATKRAAAEGHEIGNHSWSHPELTTLSASGVYSQLSRTQSAIKNLTEQTPKLMRPPYGSKNSTVLNQSAGLGLAVILWDIDVRTGLLEVPLPSKPISCTMCIGCILDIHDSHYSSVVAVLRAIDRLQAQGYRFVSVSEMFRLKGITLKPGVVYYHAQ